MVRVFITGSSDGLGLMAAQLLVKDGHKVVLHARNAQRAKAALAGCPGAETVLLGDLASISQVKSLANEVNKLGPFDAVIHNAGVGYQEASRGNTEDGLPRVFAVNSLAPYILTCLIESPKRLVYVSSGLHTSGDGSLRDLTWKDRRWNAFQAYSDSKLHNVLLSNAVARHRKGKILANSVSPGWVATKMGGSGASDDLQQGPTTQCWLAVSEDDAAKVSGKYWYHQQDKAPLEIALDETVQEEYLSKCEVISGVKL